jgi:aldehyde dehydrogenase (NAD+)
LRRRWLADDTPITGGHLLAQIYEEAGLPAGLLNVVVGEVAEIGDAFTLLSFTGSTGVGKHIGELAMTGPALKRVALELGGNSPLVVLDDADLDRAVDAAVFGRFFHQGQICMSANRLLVDATDRVAVSIEGIGDLVNIIEQETIFSLHDSH